MKAVIHVNHAEHQRTHASAMRAGLERHGIAVAFAPFDQPSPCDIAVVWGWHQQRVKESGALLLVMERGHLPDRMAWTSCGWDGLANRARYPEARDGGARWRRHFGYLMQPWRTLEGHVLVLGQVMGDASLRGLDIRQWEAATCAALIARGHRVRFRPHPSSARRGGQSVPAGVPGGMGDTPKSPEASAGTLADDLAGAALAVTYNSTAGVEAVLAGVPTVTMDAGAMAWPVTTHAIDAPPIRPERAAWAHGLAWTNWSMDELADGIAWEALATCL